MRRLLLLLTGAAALAVMGIACGSVNSPAPHGKTQLSVSTGAYQPGSYQSLSDSCHLNFDPTGSNLDVFTGPNRIAANLDLQFPGSNAPPTFFTLSTSLTNTLVASQTATLHYQAVHGFGGGGIFCTAQETFKATAQITTDDTLAVTLETDLARTSGPQCGELLGYSNLALPCSSIEAFVLRKQGPPSTPVGPTPTPTPATVSGTLSGRSDLGHLVDYFNSTSFGMAASFHATLNSSNLINPGQSWFCYAPDYQNVFSYGAVAEGSTASFYLTVTTGSWGVGARTVDPAAGVYLELITLDSNFNPRFDVVGQSGTVTLSSAGRVVDAAKSHCKYSFTNVSVSGYKLDLAPPAPHSAAASRRELDAFLRGRPLRGVFLTPAQ